MNELVQQLISSLGINEGQAKGGAGLLFKLAKDKLGGGEFSKLTDAVGNVDDLISSAPKASGLSSMLGGLASKVGGEHMGDLAELASGFKDLNMDTGLIKKMIEQVMDFTRSKGGETAADLLKGVLKG